MYHGWQAYKLQEPTWNHFLSKLSTSKLLSKCFLTIGSLRKFYHINKCYGNTKKLYPRSERFSNTASVTYQTVVMRRMLLSLHVGQWNALLDVTRLQKKARFTTLSFKQLCHPLKQQLTLVVRPSPVSSESQSVHLDSFLLLQNGRNTLLYIILIRRSFTGHQGAPS